MASLTDRRTAPGSPVARGVTLLSTAHPGPAFAVVLLGAALGVSLGLGPGRVALVAAALLAGQLSIGWSNDLLDDDRDRTVGRTDKPIASGLVPRRHAEVACAVAVVAAVVLSLACGLVAGLVHLVCVAAGWAYNLGAKATVLSWVPYAVAFGGLPVFVTLAEPDAGLPPWWLPLAGALLGVGAHLVNVLPDLDDDVATGVRGLAHRVGARTASVLAVASLAAASVVIAAGVGFTPRVVVGGGLVLVAGLAAVALLARGRTPFRAAIAIAVVDVLMLVVAA